MKNEQDAAAKLIKHAHDKIDQSYLLKILSLTYCEKTEVYTPMFPPPPIRILP